MILLVAGVAALTHAQAAPPGIQTDPAQSAPWAPSRPQGATAYVRCRATVEGRLSDCALVSAPSARLGSDAIRLTHLMRVKPILRDGRPVEAVVTIPVKFQSSDDGVRTAAPVAPALQP